MEYYHYKNNIEKKVLGWYNYTIDNNIFKIFKSNNLIKKINLNKVKIIIKWYETNSVFLKDRKIIFSMIEFIDNKNKSVLVNRSGFPIELIWLLSKYNYEFDTDEPEFFREKLTNFLNKKRILTMGKTLHPDILKTVYEFL